VSCRLIFKGDELSSTDQKYDVKDLKIFGWRYLSLFGASRCPLGPQLG
jgi:hypothetical protein